MWIEGLWQSVRLLFESILPLLERPAIQRQIIAASLTFILAWLIPVASARMLHKRNSPSDADAGDATDRGSWSFYRLTLVMDQIYFPTLGIFFDTVAIRFFTEQQWLFGLLQQLQIYFVLLLAYRIIVASVYFFFSERQAQRYYTRFLKPLFLLAILMGVSQLLSDVVAFADQHLFTVSGRTITIGSLFAALVVFYLFLAVSWLLHDLLTYLILPRLELEAGMSNTILTVSQYLVVAAGILSPLAMLGIDLSTLAIIGAGLSVGIGFGLQELVANFISGILLLFEQSIRPGDVVEVNGNLGTVERLRIRSTTIRTRDNVEIIVPNQNLLTSSVTT